VKRRRGRGGPMRWFRCRWCGVVGSRRGCRRGGWTASVGLGCGWFPGLGLAVERASCCLGGQCRKRLLVQGIGQSLVAGVAPAPSPARGHRRGGQRSAHADSPTRPPRGQSTPGQDPTVAVLEFNVAMGLGPVVAQIQHLQSSTYREPPSSRGRLQRPHGFVLQARHPSSHHASSFTGRGTIEK
jgi:hypothetical protein